MYRNYFKSYLIEEKTNKSQLCKCVVFFSNLGYRIVSVYIDKNWILPDSSSHFVAIFYSTY